jgi:nitronate monooxygenase
MDPNLDKNLVIVEMIETISQKLKKIESNLATSDLQVLLMVNDELDDVLLTKAFTGMASNWLKPSVRAVGLDPDHLPEPQDPAEAAARYGTGQNGGRPARWADIWSAGHSVSGVHDVPSTAQVVDRLEAEYRAAPHFT